MRLVILSLVCSFAAHADSYVIHAGTVLAVPGEITRERVSIVVEDGDIARMEEGFLDPSELDIDAEIVDLRNAFVLPGMLDMHTHLTMERDPAGNKDAWLSKDDSFQALEALPYLERTLHAGFTAVRNVGGDPDVIFALRDAQQQGWIEGPRIFAAGFAVTPTGGHADIHRYRGEVLEAFARGGVCDGVDDCRRVTRALVKRGADVVKVTATGGVLSNTAAGVEQQLTDDELTEIVTTAHSLGRKVAAHAHGAGGINAALAAGVDSIEHGSFLDDRSIELFNEREAYLVPTLLAGVTVIEEAKTNMQMSEAIRAKVALVGPQMRSAFQRALSGGVKIAFGTDSGVSRHGENAREFELMVDYGMEAEQAIRSATVVAAELLGQSERLGTIESGKFADLIAVDADPRANISSLLDVEFVMQGGVIVRNQFE